MLMTQRKAYQYLKKNNFKYKNRSIVLRTVRTLIDNGILKARKCPCESGFLIDKKDLDKLLDA
jgi:hypothetical protein